MTELIQSIDWVAQQFWSGPLLILLIFVGVYQTLALRGLQFRYLGHALKIVFCPFLDKSIKTASNPEIKNPEEKKKGDISSFQSLMTALAGAIGTGNITGIATAVTVGGLGSLFWMWVIALLGMIISYSEVVLAVRFRVQNSDGEMSGGPMYTLARGLQAKKLAIAFAIFAAIAAFGIGCMVQSNSVADAMETLFSTERWLSGIILMIVVGAVVLGGIQSIGRLAGVIVPFMALGYLFAGAVVLVVHASEIPNALTLIFTSAFSGQAALGGFAGATLMQAIEKGASNGLFANEAGLGSLPIAAASAQVHMPARQGMFAICGVFISTMVICTITGLVLAVSGVVGQVNEAGMLITGSPLAIMAFGTVVPEFKYIVLFGLIFFAFTTILAWSYYGEKCFEYLFGTEISHFYRWVYTAGVFVGAVLELELVWAVAHCMNALMALPNLYSIVRLSNSVKAETQAYLKQLAL